jgi:DNA-binding MarR family transcriptional regulator
MRTVSVRMFGEPGSVSDSQSRIAIAERPPRVKETRHAPCSPRAQMHFMAFAFKRAHYTSLRLGRKYAARFGLTPARFDMLYAIRRDKNRSQAFLARTLGVAGVTVSRMLRKLEALGFVHRSAFGWPDRRAKRVRLTNLGRRHLQLVLRKLKRRSMQFAFMRAIFCQKGFSRFLALDDFHSLVSRINERLGDRASLRYPTWHPDD